MPTPTPTAEPYVPSTGSPDDEGEEILDASGEGFSVGFDLGRKVGYQAGRDWAWDMLLICLGAVAKAEGGKKKKAMKKGKKFKASQCFLESLTCILANESLTRPQLRAKVEQAKEAFTDLGLKDKVNQIIEDHWKWAE